MTTLLETHAVGRLQELEAVVHAAGRGLLEAGDALEQIKKGKLYRERCETFDHYCHTAFGFTPQYANKLIKAWRTYKCEKNSYNLRHQERDFETFPETADFWRQVSQVPEGDDRDEVLGRCWELKQAEHRELRARDAREIWQQIQGEVLSTDPDDDVAEDGEDDASISPVDDNDVPVDLVALVEAISGGSELTELLEPLSKETRAALGKELVKKVFELQKARQNLTAAMKTLGVSLPTATASRWRAAIKKLLRSA